MAVLELTRAGLWGSAMAFGSPPRESGYAALERLAIEVAGRSGKLNDRIKSLPPSEVRRALRDMDGAGWLSLPPTEAA